MAAGDLRGRDDHLEPEAESAMTNLSRHAVRATVYASMLLLTGCIVFTCRV